MSRYELEEGKQYFSIKTLLIVIVLIALAIWSYQQSLKESGKETKQIDIPSDYTASSKDQEGLEGDDLKRVLNPQGKQAPETDQILENKQPLPPLEQSDDSFKMSISQVSKELARWFNPKHVIRKYITLINDLSQQQILFKNRKFIKSPQKIIVKSDSQGLYLTQESYRRFDKFANAVASIDVDKGLNLFLTYRPLFIQVYDGFGYPQKYGLEDIFLKAAASVLDAPVIDTRIALLKHSIRYKFADKKLEALNDVDKQMLRMGPGNTKKIKAKIRELVEAISKLEE